jgi:hypothetical protein
MRRQTLSGVVMAGLLAVGVAAQSQDAAKKEVQGAGGTPVTFAGCIERDSAGPTGSGTMGNAAANPVTTQNAIKLTHAEWKSGPKLAEKSESGESKDKDVRLIAQDKNVDLTKHIGHKVEVSGAWSNSPDTMGTVGAGGSGQGGSGTGGTAMNPRSGASAPGSSGPRDAMRHLLVVSSLKMVAASCDAK